MISACRKSRAAIRAVALLGLAMAEAHAQEKSPEDRLRDALRQAVSEMRAAQDQAAQLQSQLTQAQQERDAAKAAQAAAEAKLAAQPAQPAAKPDEVAQLQNELAAARGEARNAAAGLSRLQSQVGAATGLAEQKNAEAQRLSQGLAGEARALETCKATNAKLIGVAEDILHLYETQSFRALLVKSYEPVIGFWRVKLENTVQDYDDRIHDQEYRGPLPASAVTKTK